MAPNDQDPELENRKAQAFERILAEALSPDARKTDCPDAEILAAFYERALDPPEVARWRAHFAGCPRCQQTLIAMAASDPTPLADEEVERLGKLVAAAPGGVAPRPRVLKFLWYLDPRTLAPFAAAAVFAGALWLAVHSPHVAPVEVNLVPVASPAEPLIAENQPAPPPPTALTRQSAVSPAPAASAHNPAIGASPPAPPPPTPAATARSAENRESADESMQEAKKIAPAAAAQSSSPAAQEQSATEDAMGSAADAKSSSGAAAAAPASGGVMNGMAAAPLYSTVSPKAKSLRTQAGAAGQAQDKNNPQIIWRFGRAGRIERTTDGSATWTPESSPVQTDLLAGSAPSDTVCWIVGRDGTILRSTNGTTWQLVSSPAQAEQNGQPPDWTLVEALDGSSAVIGTADGRRFSTSDGGKTWQPQ